MRGATRNSIVLLTLAAAVLAGGCAGHLRTQPTRSAGSSGPEDSVEVAGEPLPAPLMAAEEKVSPDVVAEQADPVDLLIQKADDNYMDGLQALRSGREREAQRAFDRAVSLYIEAPGASADDPLLREQYEDLLDAIHRVEVENRTGSLSEPLERSEDLRGITAFLSPRDAVREEDRVRAKSATVAYDVPVEINEKVVAFIDAFSGPRKKMFEPGMVRSGRYVPMVRRIFQEEGVPQDLCYLAHIESAFKPNAYSRARAKGLFQFIASTGRSYGLRSDWWVDMRSDPELSARASARYLKTLYDVYGDWYLAMAEYNGGTRVRRAWQRSGRKADFWDLARGRSIRSETRNYVPQILAAIVLHKAPEKYGMTTERAKPLTYESVYLDESLDLRVAARLAGTTVEGLLELNPALRRLATPPNYKSFPLRLPEGSANMFNVELAKLPEAEKLPWYHHRVQRGETLSTIAARYGTSIYGIQQANSLRNPHRISIGQDLMIPGSAVRVAALDGRAGGGGTPDGTRVTHRVRRGDTLHSIARRYRTDVRSVASWNSIADPRLIRPGQRLVVYAGTRSGGSTPVGRSNARAGGAGRERQASIHKVRRGESLYSIARRYGVSVRAVQSWNDMGSKTLIHPGLKLTIYR